MKSAGSGRSFTRAVANVAVRVEIRAEITVGTPLTEHAVPLRDTCRVMRVWVAASSRLALSLRPANLRRAPLHQDAPVYRRGPGFNPPEPPKPEPLKPSGDQRLVSRANTQLLPKVFVATARH